MQVPDIKTHLIYVQKLVSDNGWQFTIDSDSCFLTDKVLKKKIRFIKWARGLLLLEDQANLCFTSVRQTTSSMGHPSFVSMKGYFSTLFCDIDIDTLSCTACQLAKHKRSSFKMLN